MEHYREKLRLQVRIHTVIAILTALFALSAFLGQADLVPPEAAGSSPSGAERSSVCWAEQCSAWSSPLSAAERL